MIPRYSTPAMDELWSEAHKLAVWKEVETLVVEAWVELGVAPPEAARAAYAHYLLAHGSCPYCAGKVWNLTQ